MTENAALRDEIALLKQKIARKEAIEEAMEQIAILFISPSSLDDAFNIALDRLLILSGADKAVIMEVNKDNPALVSMTYEKCRKGVRSVMKYAKNILREENKWFKKVHEQYGYISITNSADIPPEARSEKRLFKKHKIGATLMASFASNKEFRGNLHLECKNPVEKWEPEIVRMVIFIAVLIEHSLERREAEEKLINEKERAEQSDKMKSAFMANLSHEIRTPLNGIMGFTKLMARARFDEDKQSHYGKLIERSSKHLVSIIDDLIDLSRIESGSITILPTQINLKEIIIGCYETFAYDLQKKKAISFKLELPQQENEVQIKTDPRRLRQIIDNLMKNAIQYTESGIITLGYEVGKKVVVIFVSDTGIGIEKENLPKVFNRFWQVEHKKARNYGGSGLGLSISKDFAQMLGGDIKVKSKSGKGSRFILELPL